jgi:ADP-heptose:LPS heptosyltransferase
MINLKNKSREIIIDLHHGIGDLVMFIPTLNILLKELHTNSKTYVIVRSNLEANFLQIIFPKLVGNIICFSNNNIFTLIMRIRKIKPYLFFFPMTSDSFKTFLFAKICRSKFTCGTFFEKSIFKYSITQKRSKYHRSEYYFNFLNLLGLNSEMINYDFSKKEILEFMINKNLLFDYSKQNSKYIVFSPGSGEIESHKRWPPEKYIELAKKILNDNINFKIILIGSLNEKKLLHEIFINLNFFKERIKLVFPKNLLDTLNLLMKSDALICADAGTIHLASFINLPVLGLYGPGNPGEFGPRTNKKRIVRAGLACSPCYRKNFIKGCSTPICMKNIEFLIVYQELKLLLNKQYNNSNKWYNYTKATKSSSIII